MKFFRNQKGTSLIIFALSTTVFIGMASLAIDVGMIMTARNQLQSTVDGSALAAATGLQVSQSEAILRGIAISQADTLISETVDLEETDFTFIGINQVQVSANRPVTLFFSQFLGLNQTQVTANAIAEMSNRDIMLIFDRSGSMDDDTADPDKPQPISDTEAAAQFFVQRIKNNQFVEDQIGLVSYSTDARLDVHLGLEFQNIRKELADFVADGFTNIGDAIKIANEELISSPNSTRAKYEILLSDGIANRPLNVGEPKDYALSYANAAKDNHIKIYTISLGANADQTLMQEIADITGAEHYYSPSTAELTLIFDKIAKKVPSRLIG